MMDPIYNKGEINVIPNVTVKDPISDIHLWLNFKEYGFSFNNVSTCATASGLKFISCIDICVDHNFGVGKQNLNDRLQCLTADPLSTSVPVQCSQVITSQTTEVHNDKVVGAITHADLNQQLHLETDELYDADFVFDNFGSTPNRTMIVLKPRICGFLKEPYLTMARNINGKIISCQEKQLAAINSIAGGEGNKDIPKPEKIEEVVQLGLDHIQDKIDNTIDKIADFVHPEPKTQKFKQMMSRVQTFAPIFTQQLNHPHPMKELTSTQQAAAVFGQSEQLLSGDSLSQEKNAKRIAPN